MEENICKVNDKGLNSKIHKQLVQLDVKIKEPRQKMGGRSPKDRSFSKNSIQMAKKHMQRCSTSLVIREMQIKASMRYHLALFRMAIIKKSTNNKC